MSPARYIMIGGFLGAGKSTAIGLLARRLSDQGLRVGLITNDQGAGLVDTTHLRSRGFNVEEIAGGCFCCRFDSLVEAARKLSAQTRPEVFIAEPVGSCTDLIASVSYPLRRIYGDEFSIAPLSVLLDPIRARRVLGLDSGRSFSPKVSYIYQKQLEEADLIVINKTDLIEEADRAGLKEKLAELYPKAEIFEVSARDEGGLEPWFARITKGESPEGRALDIDYKVYGEGEALLGWLNCTVRMDSAEEFDGNAAIADLAGAIQSRLDQISAEVAHLKMTLSPDGGIGEIGLLSLVRQDAVPELGSRLPEPILGGQLIINLRAEADPQDLKTLVEQELMGYSERTRVTLRLDHIESFRPSEPRPTYRMSEQPPQG